ncbi:MAG: DinB family protein [Rhodospirillales bacterium]|nr:DinB family protein [Rhodospirillales bacterium]
MDAPEDRDAAVSRYREGPMLLEQAVTGLSDTALDAKPSGGGWSIRQIVHHVADGDYIWTLGIKMAIGNEEAEFDLKWYGSLTQDTWADRWAYSQRSIAESLALLKATRDHVLQLLESVPEAWKRAVVVRTSKGEIERVPVGFVIQMQADHVLLHIKRINAIVQEGHGITGVRDTLCET